MAWLDHITRAALQLGAYIRIRGLPYLWTSRGASGSATVDGESYTVSPTLVLDEITTSESLEPWAGIPAPGQLSVRMRRDAAWLDYLSRSVYRGAVAVLAADAAPADTTLTLTHTSGFAASGTVHIGVEAVTYTGTTATELTGCTRGAWGSPALTHVATWDGVDVRSYGGPYVSDHPLTATGRVLELWLQPGVELGGTWYPHGAYCGAEDRLAWVGTVESVKLSPDLAHVQVQATDLLGLLDREIATRLPRGTTGHELRDYVSLDDWSRACAARLYRTESPGEATISYGTTPTIGTEPLGSSGLYSYGQLGAMMAEALGVDSVQVDTYGEVARVRVTPDQAGYLAGYRYTLRPLVTPRSVWAELGFVDGVEAPGEVGLDGIYRYTLVADAPPLRLRLPRSALRRVWYTPADTVFPYDPASAGTFTDDSGDPVGGYVRVGEEVVRASRGWLNVGSAGKAYYLAISERGCLGSQDIDREEEDPVDVVWGVGLVDIEWRRALGYLLRAGATDGTSLGGAGWRGTGLGLHVDLVDDAVFTGGDRVSVWVDEATTLRDAVERALLVPQQHYLTVEAGRLTLREYPRGLSSDVTAHVVDHDDVDTAAGVSWDVPEDLICHTVRATGAGYDHGSKSEDRAITVIQGQSLATWGRSEPVEVDLRYVRDYARARQAAYALMDRLSRWASPFLTLRIQCGSRLPWLVELGDVVEVTHTLLPQLDAAALGVTALRGWVYGVERAYRSDGTKGQITILVPSVDGTRPTAWAPSALGTNVAGNTITIDTTYGTHPFQVGWKVHVYTPGDESTAVSRTVQSVSATQIVTSVACGLTAPVVVELDTWSTVGDEEATYCYLATGAPALIDSTDRPYTYG